MNKSLTKQIRTSLSSENVQLRKEITMEIMKSTTKVMFGKYLFVSNVSISVVLSATGDTLEQYYRNHLSSESPPGGGSWNSTRTVHMSAAGFSVGVLCHHGYRVLDRLYPGRSVKTVIRKLLFDQIFISPVLISVCLLTLGALEGSNPHALATEFRDKFTRLYLAEWMIWPPAQLLNFALLSPRYRVLYDNTISLGYDVYTSYVKHDHS